MKAKVDADSNSEAVSAIQSDRNKVIAEFMKQYIDATGLLIEELKVVHSLKKYNENELVVEFWIEKK